MPAPSANRIRIELTQYGPGVSVGGWDKDEDKGTNAGFGSFGNGLVDGQTCAITRAISSFFGAALLPEDDIQVETEDGAVLFVGKYGDRAEWNNPAFTDPKKWPADFHLARVDRFMAHEAPKLPDGLTVPLYASLPVRRATAA